MRVAIHDFGGYPFTAQLGRALAARGHDVTYLYAAGIKQPRARVVRRSGDPMSIAYRGITLTERYHRGAGLRRFAQERRYGRRLASEIRQLRPEIVISANCPIGAQVAACDAAAEADARFVHWCQDVYSLAVSRILARRFGVAGRVVGAVLARWERQVVRRSDAVVMISEDFWPVMRAWHVREDRAFVIENWAPLDELRPMDKANEWAERHGLGAAPAFLYAGTLGRKHDPALLVRLAEALPNAKVVVVAEGTGADRLRHLTTAPSNLLVLPPQPLEDVPMMLASADVLVALLEPDAREFSVPSKVLTYLAAGRPIVAAMPAANLAARTIAAAGAGTVVDPGDTERFISEARLLLEDEDGRALAGRQGRAYAERAFDIDAKADEFERVLMAASQRFHSAPTSTGDTDDRTA